MLGFLAKKWLGLKITLTFSTGILRSQKVSNDVCEHEPDTYTGQSSGRGMCVVPTTIQEMSRAKTREWRGATHQQ